MGVCLPGGKPGKWDNVKGDWEGELKDMGWYDERMITATHPVGKKTPNAWGLYKLLSSGSGNGVGFPRRAAHCALPGLSPFSPACPPPCQSERGGRAAAGAPVASIHGSRQPFLTSVRFTMSRSVAGSPGRRRTRRWRRVFRGRARRAAQARRAENGKCPGGQRFATPPPRTLLFATRRFW